MESAQSWKELLLDLKRRGLSMGPELAVADAAGSPRAASTLSSNALRPLNWRSWLNAVLWLSCGQNFGPAAGAGRAFFAWSFPPSQNFHREVGRLFAFEDAIDIRRCRRSASRVNPFIECAAARS